MYEIENVIRFNTYNASFAKNASRTTENGPGNGSENQTIERAPPMIVFPALIPAARRRCGISIRYSKSSGVSFRRSPDGVTHVRNLALQEPASSLAAGCAAGLFFPLFGRRKSEAFAVESPKPQSDHLQTGLHRRKFKQGVRRSATTKREGNCNCSDGCFV